jgi:hypothetical protein
MEIINERIYPYQNNNVRVNMIESSVIRVRAFQCPNCDEFIATNAERCRFCNYQIDTGGANIAADLQEKENTRYRRRKYVKHIFSGLLTAIIGIAVAVSQIMTGGATFTVWIIFVGGMGDMIYGLAGWLKNEG